MSKFNRKINDPENFRANVVANLNSIIQNQKISENLEKGIYNYSLDVSEEKKIIKKWSNESFVVIYIQKLRTLILNLKNKELLDLNYRLMQLKEVDINGNAKMLALNKVKGDIDKLNTFEFKKMFMADKMYTVIKDLDSWLNSSFNSLNAFASLGKD